jgi:hypothetical protein
VPELIKGWSGAAAERATASELGYAASNWVAIAGSISLCSTKKTLEGQGHKKISVPLLRTNFKCRVAQCDDEIADCAIEFLHIAIHRHKPISLFWVRHHLFIRTLEGRWRTLA